MVTIPALSPANVSKVINKWLFLYPDELRCGGLDEDVTSTYEEYVANAETQVKATFESCEGFDWPSEAVRQPPSDRPLSSSSDANSTSSSKPEAEQRKNLLFYEGIYYFDKLPSTFLNVLYVFTSFLLSWSSIALISKSFICPSISSYLYVTSILTSSICNVLGNCSLAFEFSFTSFVWT